MDDKCKRCMNREEICNDSMQILCKRNGFDAFSPVTNADKYFRYATDEEIVEAWYFVYHHIIFNSTNSRQGLLDWLKQEVNDEMP